MGKVRMGNSSTKAPSRHVSIPLEPEVIIQKEYIEVPSEPEIIVKEKIVEVSEGVNTKQLEDVLMSHIDSLHSKINDVEDNSRNMVNNLGESAAESLDIALQQVEMAKKVVNRQGAAIVHLRADMARKEGKRKRILKRLLSARKKSRDMEKETKLAKKLAMCSIVLSAVLGILIILK